MKSIDADSWNELRKDSGPGACLFGHFLFNQTFEQFSVARDSYLRAERNVVGTRELVPAQHIEIPETSNITRGEVVSAIAVAQPKMTNVAAAAAPKSTWSLALNAPEQMINGTRCSATLRNLIRNNRAKASHALRLVNRLKTLGFDLQIAPGTIRDAQRFRVQL